MQATGVPSLGNPPGKPFRWSWLGVGLDLAALGILAALSLLAGWGGNQWRSQPLGWTYRSRAESLQAAVDSVAPNNVVPAGPADAAELPHEIRLEEFQSFVADHRGIVLDARPAVFYREGHVPGALSLPRETFAEDYPRVREKLEAFKNGPIVVYCSGADCPDSELLSNALTALGYRHLLIYTSGWDEWSHTGLPQEGPSTPP